MNATAGPPREDADRETSSEAYARRFAGPVGAWFLDVQARLTLELLSPWPRASVLDVGGGHAQLAGPLTRAGYDVTVLGSDTSCAGRLLERPEARSVRFVCGDLLRAPWPDGSFDVVLAFRLLPHVTRWPALVAELTRLARQAVIVDYPSRRSVNAVAEPLFGLKRGIEKNTRPFTVFKDADIARAFAACGSTVTARRPQFFFPMALHRALHRAALSRGLEVLPSALGLTRVFGSPVILRCQVLH